MNEWRLILCRVMAETVAFLLCERDRKVDTRHIQTVMANGAKCRIEDYWLMSEDSLECHSVLLRLL